MKKWSTYKDQLMVALITAMIAPEVLADTQLQLTNISGTSGAGSADFTTWVTKITTYFQSGLNLVLVFFAFSGIVLCGTSVKKVYDANKDNREPPKIAVIGIFVGAAMTIIPVIIGILRNSATPS
ncbi:hypothetical protein R70006_05000 [Paraburkholderia domus]|uniref:hypothetical protein n=1 Tax=Paraburkholderia domus TaxID=2793075 RepID=UPI001B1A4D9F|nr:hypothetical protein [Paraburkholderia domus]CAE6794364.1 hypothetical protein R70006_05000 [Paraburkholderia domus]